MKMLIKCQLLFITIMLNIYQWFVAASTPYIITRIMTLQVSAYNFIIFIEDPEMDLCPGNISRTLPQQLPY
jgi:hypothetical protein